MQQSHRYRVHRLHRTLHEPIPTSWPSTVSLLASIKLHQTMTGVQEPKIYPSSEAEGCREPVLLQGWAHLREEDLAKLHNVGMGHAQPVVEHFSHHSPADASTPLQKLDCHLEHNHTRITFGSSADGHNTTKSIDCVRWQHAQLRPWDGRNRAKSAEVLLERASCAARREGADLLVCGCVKCEHDDAKGALIKVMHLLVARVARQEIRRRRSLILHLVSPLPLAPSTLCSAAMLEHGCHACTTIKPSFGVVEAPEGACWNVRTLLFLQAS